MKSFMEWGIEKDPELIEEAFMDTLRGWGQKAGSWLQGKAQGWGDKVAGAVQGIGQAMMPDKVKQFEMLKGQLEQLQKQADAFLAQEKGKMSPEEQKGMTELSNTARGHLRVVGLLQQKLKATPPAAPGGTA